MGFYWFFCLTLLIPRENIQSLMPKICWNLFVPRAVFWIQIWTTENRTLGYSFYALFKVFSIDKYSIGQIKSKSMRNTLGSCTRSQPIQCQWKVLLIVRFRDSCKSWNSIVCNRKIIKIESAKNSQVRIHVCYVELICYERHANGMYVPVSNGT